MAKSGRPHSTRTLGGPDASGEADPGRPDKHGRTPRAAPRPSPAKSARPAKEPPGRNGSAHCVDGGEAAAAGPADQRRARPWVNAPAGRVRVPNRSIPAAAVKTVRQAGSARPPRRRRAVKRAQGAPARSPGRAPRCNGEQRAARRLAEIAAPRDAEARRAGARARRAGSPGRLPPSRSGAPRPSPPRQPLPRTSRRAATGAPISDAQRRGARPQHRSARSSRAARSLAAYLRPRETGEIKTTIGDDIGEMVRSIGHVAEYYMADPQRAFEAQTALTHPVHRSLGGDAAALPGRAGRAGRRARRRRQALLRRRVARQSVLRFHQAGLCADDALGGDLVKRADELEPHERDKAQFYLRQVTGGAVALQLRRHQPGASAHDARRKRREPGAGAEDAGRGHRGRARQPAHAPGRRARASSSASTWPRRPAR